MYTGSEKNVKVARMLLEDLIICGWDPQEVTLTHDTIKHLRIRVVISVWVDPPRAHGKRTSSLASRESAHERGCAEEAARLLRQLQDLPQVQVEQDGQRLEPSVILGV